MPEISTLLDWYDKNRRVLPWRQTRDPYKIWLSEIILQQTRVNQGLSYYLKFVEKYPKIQQLADADEDEILKLWQGLGYYSRARNMHHAAKFVAEQMQGKFPDNYDDILKLKGVGPYTAAAISSIVFHEPKPVMDGNVMRVISRWYAIRESVDSTKGKKQIAEILETLIDREKPGQFNQAMMEFGAKYCKPKNPDCENCIFAEKCLAFSQNLVADLPKKMGKSKIRKRFFYYLVFRFGNGDATFTLLNKRSGNDIWKGLYEFPLIEMEYEEPVDHVLNHPRFKSLINHNHYVVRHISRPVSHQLTHQKIIAKFMVIDAEINPPEPDGLINVRLPEFQKYPISRLTAKFLETNPI